MKIWKVSPRDSILATFSVAHFVFSFYFAASWDEAGTVARLAGFLTLVVMMTYNIIVVSHLFTHVPWFAVPFLNSITSFLNSVNIGQSVQAYQLTHVRNHHRHNNDTLGKDKTTRDFSSTYRRGKKGDHEALLPYIFGGAFSSLVDRARDFVAITRLWRVGPNEVRLLSLATRAPHRRKRELTQIQLDRVGHCGSLVVFALISWQWTLVAYLPAYFLALTLVNVQNYYRHYGADPGNRVADSVSHYGWLYNLVTFNDGYHQEHHLKPNAHWSQLPEVYRRYRSELDDARRIVSPVPAMLGFFHFRRPQLHRDSNTSTK